ncbi:flavin reductase family protein [Pacificibacter marinus]|uniref:flavin reductase family protein n=1 Tax=Pacificibacter marinus TaxID=658057 RepID=UPI001C07E948|nr:flavin reductase family protein [Pacificibacter marinus]MBU2867496.1 flavin reductase family protein [Pacificibacter marinus]
MINAQTNTQYDNSRSETLKPSLDATDFRAAMGSFLTGVALITTCHEGTKFGITVNSLTSVSMEPCQLLVCFNHNSAAANAIRERGMFVVNILSAHHKDLAMCFARPSDTDRFTGISHSMNDHGLPVFEDALCSVVCTLDQTLISGDHEIFIGAAQSVVVNDREPLAYFRGSMDISLDRGLKGARS